MATPEAVEQVLQAYESVGMTRIQAITTAIQEEKLERDTSGNLKLRPPSRRPGRQLLGV